MRTPTVALATLLLAASALTVTAAPVLAAPDAAERAPVRAANPWLSFRVLDMAPSGGEAEAPTNTLYAFKRAKRLGADMLELDVQSTKDKRLVVLHDAAVDNTTNGTGRVRKMTLAQVQALDAAYWFVDGEGTEHGKPARKYRLRGARDGARTIKGYRPDDFAVPTLDAVFKKFKHTPINIEIKGSADTDTRSFVRTAKLLSRFLAKSGRTDVIVTSFNDAALARFHALSPQTGLAPGKQGLTDYFLSGIKPIEGTVALQVPITFSGFPIVTREFVSRAHADGYAVHAWFSGTAPDDAATYNRVIDACVDALMPARPSLLESILDERGITRPGHPGVDPCAA